MLKLTKKLGGAVLAVAATLALSSVAFAATIGSDGTVTATDNTVTIPKQIIFVNDEATNVREPNLTYTYTLSSATPSAATIEDADGIKTTVKAGVIAANTNTNHQATVTFADTNRSAASANGTADEKTFDFTFDPSQFTEPGVYRYLVHETVSPTKASKGVVEAATYSADRYLDVYVKRAATGSNTMEIYGYVLSEDTASTSFKGNAPTSNLDKKSTGYVDTDSDSTDTNHADVDVYTTYNYELNKDVQGTMADPNNDFPVSIAMTSASGVDAVKLDFALASEATLSGSATDTAGSYIMLGTLSGTVDDDSKITLTGIPAGSSVAVTETNNTPDSYKVKIGTTAAGTDLFAEATIAASGTAGPSSTQTFTAKQEAFITNTLDAISPTGIVMRYGPFAVMLVGGLALLFVATRREREDERI